MSGAEPRVGYIGLNHHHCESYLQSLAELSIEVTCACEPSPAFDVGSVEELGDVPVYRDPIELLDQEPLDVV
jgi:predicted dehydrogenase